MRYIGGKNRIAKYLSPIILETKPEVVVEPFCGSLNVTIRLLQDDPDLIVHASDAHEDLIDMWKAVQGGWRPPDKLSREEYKELKDSKESSPLRTFAGYGCSFAGKWFGGYAADSKGGNYAQFALNSIMRRVPFLDRVVLSCASYQDVMVNNSCVVYCDPPYEGTTKPGARGSFDHVAFWSWVGAQTVPCYVSEYTAPDGFRSVWEKVVKTDMHTKDGKDSRVERLFVNR